MTRHAPVYERQLHTIQTTATYRNGHGVAIFDRSRSRDRLKCFLPTMQQTFRSLCLRVVPLSSSLPFHVPSNPVISMKNSSESRRSLTPPIFFYTGDRRSDGRGKNRHLFFARSFSLKSTWYDGEYFSAGQLDRSSKSPKYAPNRQTYQRIKVSFSYCQGTASTTFQLYF